MYEFGHLKARKTPMFRIWSHLKLANLKFKAAAYRNLLWNKQNFETLEGLSANLYF